MGSSGTAATADRPTTQTGVPQREVRALPRRGWGVPILYLVLLIAVIWEFPHLGFPWETTGFLAGVILLYLGRDLSVVYTIDGEHLSAWRLFGWRRVPLESIRRIDRVSLRELAPVGFFGTWGWRSRLWSPVEGKFDAIHTFHDGILVQGDGVPLFISPREPDRFARRLLRRVERLAPGVEGPPEPSASPEASSAGG